MGKQEPFSSTDVREVDILLKEYEALRTEINTHVASQTQLTTVTIVLLGAATAAAPFLISTDSQGLHLRVPLIFLVFGLLIISTLFTSLIWATMAHDIQMAYIAQYLHTDVRARAMLLLGKSASILNWEGYRNQQMYPKSNKPRHLLVRLTVIALAIAQYVPMVVPSVVSLLAACSIYLTNFSVNTGDAIGWLDMGLSIFNLVYLLATIPSALYIAGAYAKVPSLQHLIGVH